LKEWTSTSNSKQLKPLKYIKSHIGTAEAVTLIYRPATP